MGQAKPQTATSEAIANSGLQIIKGGLVKTWCEEKKVLENSADRCMVCLGDYEEEEECRILECSESLIPLFVDASTRSLFVPRRTDASPFLLSLFQNTSSTRSALTNGFTLEGTLVLLVDLLFVFSLPFSLSLHIEDETPR